MKRYKEIINDALPALKVAEKIYSMRVGVNKHDFNRVDSEKEEKIETELDTFFSSDEAKERLQSMFSQPIFCNILSIDNDYKTMKEREFSEPEEVLECLSVYQEIIANINMKTTFIPSIENFCMFMGWTARVYKKMLQGNNIPEEIKEVMNSVNDYLLESQLSAGQRGAATVGITKLEGQDLGNNGFEMVTQKEKITEDRIGNVNKTKEDYS